MDGCMAIPLTLLIPLIMASVSIRAFSGIKRRVG